MTRINQISGRLVIELPTSSIKPLPKFSDSSAFNKQMNQYI